MIAVPPTVFITGSSIGIGRETAFQFASHGYKVALSFFRDASDAHRAADRCRALGAAEVAVIPLNLMDDASIHAAVATLISEFATLTVLVNNAGVSVRRSLEQQSFAEIERQMRTNLEGLIKLTKECLPYVSDTIINVASGAGLRGFHDLTTYCATKFGVRGFTQALAAEVPHLHIYSVNPDATATRLHAFARGRPPKDVAKVIFRTAEGQLRQQSGGDVNVWEMLEGGSSC